MLCKLQLVLCVVPSTETDWCFAHCLKTKTLVFFISDFNPSYISTVTIFLWSHIVMLKVCYTLFVKCNLTTSLTVKVCFLWAATIPFNLVKFTKKSHLCTKTKKIEHFRCTCMCNLKTSVRIYYNHTCNT